MGIVLRWVVDLRDTDLSLTGLVDLSETGDSE
jgi:hypothetical protein